MAYETCSVAANMAKRVAEHPLYRDKIGLIDIDRIAFLKAVDKKKPSSIPTPVKIEVVNEKMRCFVPHIFIVVVYMEWFSWDESKQYAALLQQLLRIETIEKDFEDGKLRKYDLLDLQFMVDNFGLNWADQDAIRHPIDEPPPRLTFQGTSGVARDTGTVEAVVTPSDEDLASLDAELDGDMDDLPDVIEEDLI